MPTSASHQLRAAAQAVRIERLALKRRIQKAGSHKLDESIAFFKRNYTAVIGLGSATLVTLGILQVVCTSSLVGFNLFGFSSIDDLILLGARSAPVAAAIVAIVVSYYVRALRWTHGPTTKPLSEEGSVLAKLVSRTSPATVLTVGVLCGVLGTIVTSMGLVALVYLQRADTLVAVTDSPASFTAKGLVGSTSEFFFFLRDGSPLRVATVRRDQVRCVVTRGEEGDGELPEICGTHPLREGASAPEVSVRWYAQNVEGCDIPKGGEILSVQFRNDESGEDDIEGAFYDPADNLGFELPTPGVLTASVASVPTGRSELEELAGRVQRELIRLDAGSVWLIGMASQGGTPAHNQDLADQRTATVAKALVCSASPGDEMCIPQIASVGSGPTPTQAMSKEREYVLKIATNPERSIHIRRRPVGENLVVGRGSALAAVGKDRRVAIVPCL